MKRATLATLAVLLFAGCATSAAQAQRQRDWDSLTPEQRIAIQENRDAERRANLHHALSHIGDGLQSASKANASSTINCSSNTVGSFTQTTCTH